MFGWFRGDGDHFIYRLIPPSPTLRNYLCVVKQESNPFFIHRAARLIKAIRIFRNHRFPELLSPYVVWHLENFPFPPVPIKYGTCRVPANAVPAVFHHHKELVDIVCVRMVDKSAMILHQHEASQLSIDSDKIWMPLRIIP